MKRILILLFILFAINSYAFPPTPPSSGGSSSGVNTTYDANSDGVIDADKVATLNQNTTGTAANLSGTPTLPNGTSATTQSAADKTTKLSTTAYVDTPTTQTFTMNDSGDANHATGTLTPTANVTRVSVALTCSDEHGCTVTMAETGAVAGAMVTITNISANHADFENQAGVLTLATTPFDLLTGESLTLVYANSQWYEVNRAVTNLRNITVSGFTANRGVKTDASGNLVVSTLTDTNLENAFGYLPVDTATDAEGKVSIDKTTDQLRIYGAAQKVVPTVQYASFVIPAPADTDDINIMKAPYGMTILSIACIVQGTTSATGQLQECDSAGANCADLDSDITCDADGAADDGSLTDNTIASAKWIRWKTASVNGTPTFLTVTFKYNVVAD